MVLNFLTGFILFALAGCGAKKKEVSTVQEFTKKDSLGISRNSGNSQEFLKLVSNLNVSAVTKIDDQNQKTTIKKTISPINPNVPAIYTDSDGKKHDLNNASYVEETIIEKNNTKSENSQKSQRSDVSELKRKTATKATVKTKVGAQNRKNDRLEKVNRDSWHFPFGFWLIIAAVVSSILIYLNKRFQWVKYVTTFIVKLFQIRKK